MNIKLIKFSIFLFLLFLFPSFVFASESIDKYDVYIKINKDSSINVLEIIDYNFDTNLKRGIYREIKKVYEDEGKKYILNIEDIRVLDKDSNPYIFEVKDNIDFLRIDIGGDVPKFSGIHRFIIHYKASPAFSYRDTYDKLYWNAIGEDWQVNIYNPFVTIELPELIESKDLFSYCYVGYYGSTENCSRNSFIYNSETSNLVNRIVYGNESFVGNGKGMTVVLEIPKGIVEEIEQKEILPLPIFFPYLIFLSLIFPIIAIVLLFKKAGKENIKKPIVRQYDVPNGITPSDAGVIINKNFTGKELVAELIFLAIKGYIKILSGEESFFGFKNKKIIFLKLKSEEDLLDTEKAILSTIFNPKFRIEKEEAKKYFKETSNKKIEEEIESSKEIALIDKFRNNFSIFFAIISEKAKEETFNKGFFETSFIKAGEEGLKIILKYISFSILLILFSHLTALLFFSNRLFVNLFLSYYTIIPFYILSFLVFFISLAIKFPKRTSRGIEIKEHLLGLKEYIKVAEKERMEFHFDPKSNPELFEKLLPFAIILGVEKKWVSHLKDLEYNPNWYMGANSQAFKISTFNSLSKAICNSSGVSSSSSGGRGGSVGGGRGGGGGGSR